MLIHKSARRAGGRTRDPEKTRQKLLNAAFQEVYRSGFQSADLDTIIGKAGVTKGALYHHFENKEALGYALVEEVITELTREKWVRPLAAAKNPIDELIRIFEADPLMIRDGCPLNNLSQEMSALHEGFRKRLGKVFHEWQTAIANGLREGQKARQVRADIDANDSATFIMALYEGYLSLAKNAQDPKLLESGHRSLIGHLESLRETKGRR